MIIQNKNSLRKEVKDRIGDPDASKRHCGLSFFRNGNWTIHKEGEYVLGTWITINFFWLNRERSGQFDWPWRKIVDFNISEIFEQLEQWETMGKVS